MLIAAAIFGYLFVGVLFACLFYRYQISIFMLGPCEYSADKQDAFMSVIFYPFFIFGALIRVFFAWPIFWLLDKVGTVR